jgi:alpha-amylase/alpha-mannosidase (GH57 family)
MTRVALLWHMHQPFYQDLVTGEHILPWVRLHALKDYWGMVALLREFPGVRMTFNLVPSLLVQLEAFAEDRARDRSLELSLKPAAALTDDDRTFIVGNFFHAQRARMIEPYPRYLELLRKREEAGNGHAAAARQYSEGELRDLQVWHKLSWVDPFYLDSDARIRTLLQKGRNYAEDDKAVLREVELEILRKVIPEYADAAARGQVELSTSPFYHPILPLLCDTDVYLRTAPQSRMPRQRFRHPEDAAAQLQKAVECHTRLFGQPPKGLWPSEGSVSDAMVPLVKAAGIDWMATDELILARSLGLSLTRDGNGHLQQPETLYRSYVVRAGEREVACLFRDHSLSDLIGFTYSGWGADAAAHDFVGRLVEGGRRFSNRTGGQEAVIPVILDGENAWEHFEGGGRPFLRALYGALQNHPEISTVTVGEACADAKNAITGIFPGSWINGDFYVWIGHADDHTAWGQLAEARQALEAPGPAADAAAIERAREELYIAEGSDWFWWYGDDHSSEHDLEFDDLFRRHVRNVYRALDKPIPDELFVTNITTEPPKTVTELPSSFVRVALDGQVTSYFEWLGAGSLVLRTTTAGAMHQVSEPTGGHQPLTLQLLFGFDPDRLYVRVDFGRRAGDLLTGAGEVRVTFMSPEDIRVRVTQTDEGVAAVFERRASREVWRVVPARPEAAAHEVLEIAVPFIDLGVQPGDAIGFFVSLHVNGQELERYPSFRPVELTVPSAEFEAYNWTA